MAYIIWITLEIIRQLCKMGLVIHRIHIFRHRRIIFNKESKGAAFGRAPQGRGAPLWLLSLLNMIILCLHMWILCIIISISRLFGMLLQIMERIPYLSPLEPFQVAREIYQQCVGEKEKEIRQESPGRLKSYILNGRAIFGRLFRVVLRNNAGEM